MFTQAYNRLIKKSGDPDAPVFLMGFESAPIRADLALYDLAEWARPQAGLAAHLAATPAGQLAAERDGAAPVPQGVEPDAWGEWQRRFAEHLAKYGHSTYDMDFSRAVAADDPASLLELCRLYLLGKAGSVVDNHVGRHVVHDDRKKQERDQQQGFTVLLADFISFEHGCLHQVSTF
jgi:pyruvate,water dikinase